MKLTLLFALLPMLSFGMDRMTALSMLETGDNDRMVGTAGEISRYQVMKREWRAVSDSTSYTDPSVAKQVATKILEQRVQRFQAAFNRPPTDFEFYALWNAPGQVFGQRISRVVAERSERFANLCNWKDNNSSIAKVSSNTKTGPVL
jgi:hypothetical protein